MRRVVVESPYAGDVDANVIYAKRCLKDCLMRGESPLASHLLYAQESVLDDLNIAERELGIQAGFEWNQLADAVVVYLDRGTSKGMELGMAFAKKNKIPIEFRKLDGSIDTKEEEETKDLRELAKIDVDRLLKQMGDMMNRYINKDESFNNVSCRELVVSRVISGFSIGWHKFIHDRMDRRYKESKRKMEELNKENKDE